LKLPTHQHRERPARGRPHASGASPVPTPVPRPPAERARRRRPRLPRQDGLVVELVPAFLGGECPRRRGWAASKGGASAALSARAHEIGMRPRPRQEPPWASRGSAAAAGAGRSQRNAHASVLGANAPPSPAGPATTWASRTPRPRRPPGGRAARSLRARGPRPRASATASAPSARAAARRRPPGRAGGRVGREGCVTTFGVRYLGGHEAPNTLPAQMEAPRPSAAGDPTRLHPQAVGGLQEGELAHGQGQVVHPRPPALRGERRIGGGRARGVPASAHPRRLQSAGRPAEEPPFPPHPANAPGAPTTLATSAPGARRAACSGGGRRWRGSPRTPARRRGRERAPGACRRRGAGGGRGAESKGARARCASPRACGGASRHGVAQARRRGALRGGAALPVHHAAGNPLRPLAGRPLTP
jgi:hypothetical protein